MNGLVLAGGLSTRLGQDKTRLRLDGQDLLAATVNLLRDALGARGGRVLLSCRAAQAQTLRTRVPGLEIVLDGQEAGGPLNGLITVLHHTGQPLLAVPCDMPRLRAGVLLRLLAERDAALVARPTLLRTLFIRPEGWLEPLPAVYETRALPLLEAAHAAGRYGLYSVIPAGQEARVLLPPDAAGALFNINTPEDLAVAGNKNGMDNPADSSSFVRPRARFTPSSTG